MRELPSRIAVASGLAGVVVAFAAGSGAGGDGAIVTRYRSRAREVCALPAYDYQHVKFAQPVVAVSQSAVLVIATDAPTADASGRRLKYFQLATTSLHVDQCSISKFAMILRDDGSWSFALRADQNAHAADSIPAAPLVAVNAPLPPTSRQTLQIKRNLFVVSVRGYAAYPLRIDDSRNTLGRPLLFEVPTATFWVQNGQPYDFRTSGRLPLSGDDFNAIDRVELQFSYR